MSDSELEKYIIGIDRFIASQPNSDIHQAIRAFNHEMMGTLNSITPLVGLRILDVGASPHGYALEKCLELGALEYVGIGLDIADEFLIEAADCRGRLIKMDAEDLAFEDNYFDAVITMSTFEHIGNLNKALSEMCRVIKPGGCVLITFEPVWTSSYGHHLHHLGSIAELIPPWAHLLWDKNEMIAYMQTQWPDNATISVMDAGAWIYESDALNRKSIIEIQRSIQNSGMHVEWMVPLLDNDRDEIQLQAAIKKTGLSRADLMTKGLSALLYKPALSMWPKKINGLKVKFRALWKAFAKIVNRLF